MGTNTGIKYTARFPEQAPARTESGSSITPRILLAGSDTEAQRPEEVPGEGVTHSGSTGKTVGAPALFSSNILLKPSSGY